MRYVSFAKECSVSFHKGDEEKMFHFEPSMLLVEKERRGSMSEVGFVSGDVGATALVPTSELRPLDTYVITAVEDDWILASGETPGICHKQMIDLIGEFYINDVQSLGQNSYEVEIIDKDGELQHFWMYVSKPEPKARVTYDYDPDTGIMEMNFYTNVDDKVPALRETITDPFKIAQIRASMSKYVNK